MYVNELNGVYEYILPQVVYEWLVGWLTIFYLLQCVAISNETFFRKKLLIHSALRVIANCKRKQFYVSWIYNRKCYIVIPCLEPFFMNMMQSTYLLLIYLKIFLHYCPSYKGTLYAKSICGMRKTCDQIHIRYMKHDVSILLS